jgi:hypothetical protein
MPGFENKSNNEPTFGDPTRSYGLLPMRNVDPSTSAASFEIHRSVNEDPLVEETETNSFSVGRSTSMLDET